MLSTEEGKNMEFIMDWFDQLDDYIRKNLHNFTCDQYSELYRSFIKIHQERCGTSQNLTGFSEYLATRFFHYLLEGSDYKLKPQERKDGKEGVNVPDLLIYKGNTIFSLISVKAYKGLSNTIIKEDLVRIDNIRTKGMKSIMLNFLTHSSSNKKTIYAHQKDDHKLLFLQSNPVNLAQEIMSYVF